jgi:hypothetical protein
MDFESLNPQPAELTIKIKGEPVRLALRFANLFDLQYVGRLDLEEANYEACCKMAWRVMDEDSRIIVKELMDAKDLEAIDYTIDAGARDYQYLMAAVVSTPDAQITNLGELDKAVATSFGWEEQGKKKA